MLPYLNLLLPTKTNLGRWDVAEELVLNERSEKNKKINKSLNNLTKWMTDQQCHQATLLAR